MTRRRRRRPAPRPAQGPGASQQPARGRQGAGSAAALGDAPRPAAAPSRRSDALQIIPLGGLGEIGKNSTVIRLGRDLLIVDAGLMFPDEELPGIDLVIPDFSAIPSLGTPRGVVLTHGHEDHVGALPYLLSNVRAPVYGTPLTLGLARRRVEETQGAPAVEAVTAAPRRPFRVGPFDVELVHVNHSIPQACAVVIRTPKGTVVCTGDFKFDQTPIDETPTDFSRLAEVGESEVLVGLMDSTNVERPGYAPSEQVVGAALDEIVARARGRILVTTFASNVHRLQQVFRTAARHGRKVAVAGRSMVGTVAIASELNALSVPKRTLVPLEQIQKLPAQQIVILTSGSQGEPMSALTRMASGTHRHVSIAGGDTVVVAAGPIPGNEAMVGRTINQLYRQGAEVIYGPGVHASGHACQEELKLMLTLLRPRLFLPVHGEYRHLILNQRLGQSVGIPKERSFVAENGQIVEAGPGGLRPVGTIEAGNVLVDGLGVGVGGIVLRDRRHLAQDGMLIALAAIDRQTGELLRDPDIISRGFVHVRESSELIEECKNRVRAAVARCRERQTTDRGAVRSAIREALSRYLFEQTHRQPMIFPLLVEV